MILESQEDIWKTLLDFNLMNSTMFKNTINIILLLATTFLFVGCEKKINDWEIDESHARLFRPLKFETSNIGATDVEIAYTRVVSADKYIFEFSKDSTEFNEIIKTVEILADTLTEFAPSTSPTRVGYRTLFSDLDGTSPYSVRMKGVNEETCDESDFVQLFFRTTEEQLFTTVDASVNGLIAYWEEGNEVTHLEITDTTSNELIDKIEIDNQAKQEGKLKIAGLQSGKVYLLEIFNNEVKRGSLYIRTAGIDGGEIIAVSPNDNLSDLINAAAIGGHKDLVVVFSGGEVYSYEDVNIPEAIENISFSGELDENRKQAEVTFKSVSMSNPLVGSVIFENLEVKASPGASFLITQEKNGSEVESYSFVNCTISGFGNGVVRVNNSVTANKISFNNCFVNKNGGWGVVNVGGSSAVVDSISFTNSTLVDLATQLMDVRVAVKKIKIQKCTFYNKNASMTQLLRFDNNRLPLELVASDNIIAGDNNGAKINSVSYDYENHGLSVSFAGSYRTNELEIERESRGFPDITVFNGDSKELFIDPDNLNFRIKPDNGFGGRGSAGDPRWYIEP